MGAPFPGRVPREPFSARDRHPHVKTSNRTVLRRSAIPSVGYPSVMRGCRSPCDIRLQRAEAFWLIIEEVAISWQDTGNGSWESHQLLYCCPCKIYIFREGEMRKWRPGVKIEERNVPSGGDRGVEIVKWCSDVYKTSKLESA